MRESIQFSDPCNYNDPSIEQKLLPLDLFSGEDEYSPRNSSRDMASNMLCTDVNQYNSFEKEMQANTNSCCCTGEHDEGNTSASSSSGRFQVTEQQMQVSEFKVLSDGNDNMSQNVSEK